MKIKLNGEEKELNNEITISKLLSQFNIPKPGTAVAINSEIIPHDVFDDHTISEGDSIDILRAIGGG